MFVSDDDVLGAVGQGAAIASWSIDRADIAGAAIALGCCEKALALTAKYTSEREQFGRPLSTNQGVAIRAADAYIDIDCMRVTMWQAAWRLAEGLPAREEIDIAKYWAAEGGQRVVHATQHLHGGMGADIDYPVHRYFLWVKQLENMFGSGPQQLARLGRSIARSATTGPAGLSSATAARAINPTPIATDAGDDRGRGQSDGQHDAAREAERLRTPPANAADRAGVARRRRW